MAGNLKLPNSRRRDGQGQVTPPPLRHAAAAQRSLAIPHLIATVLEKVVVDGEAGGRLDTRDSRVAK